MSKTINTTQHELAKELAKTCRTQEDVADAIRSLFADTVETILQAEMDAHLGYDKHAVIGNNSGNSRNGCNRKTISTQHGEAEIEIPRDRNGTFEPKIVPKYQTKGKDIENQIIGMYAKGMSTADISATMQDIYGISASKDMISSVTDKVMPLVMEWQNRPLDSVYAVVFFDGVVFKVRKDGKIINRCIYTVLGINMDGKKDILGLWISDNESASFWTLVCNDLKNRGVAQILIACHDNLNGFGSAINTVFPQTRQQLCIIHQIRNSTKHVSYKDLKPVMADLKLIYNANNAENAEFQLELFGEKWNAKYPQIYKSWRANWADLTEYFQYPDELRRLIYTTNAVEGFHRMLRKHTKNKTSFPTDDSLKKSIYLSVQEIAKKWYNPIRNWGIIIGQISVFFEDELAPKESA
ncbi:MAG: IS256 family transposase [Candidatus Bathyarchaeota archaeon]|uniref:IS256 family transposase n=1 Tax=Candidatus Bathycorpusculum sp. TaxID=2994959 RepID=UPI00281D113E|nr:IS256 family transposase [Candidatus Termiticorpusculum sp.]MCL2292358.1 IS256 family transposase [Candidatus Termiticorpusculum sp.]